MHALESTIEPGAAPPRPSCTERAFREAEHDRLRILLLDANPEDAEIVLRELEQAQFATHARRVATREEFLGVINSQADRLQRLIDNMLIG